MSQTLTCLFSLYDEATPEHLGYLHDPELGGNTKRCIRADRKGDAATALFVRIPPPQRGHPVRTLRSAATATTMSLDHAEILLQEAVYVKWAFDAKRVEALRDEAAIYAARLTPLQGTVVPRLVGFYESVDHANPFALSIFEHCSGPVLSDYTEYSRQYMMAACALHGVGVSHNQLALGLRGDARFVDRHVIADQAGRVRIVDFTRATLHCCPGAPLRVAGGAPADERRGCCDELAHLEIVVGERRTGDRATGRWLLD